MMLLLLIDEGLRMMIWFEIRIKGTRLLIDE